MATKYTLTCNAPTTDLNSDFVH